MKKKRIKAGPELDALVARKVLGWVLKPIKEWPDGSTSGPRWRTGGGNWPYAYREENLPNFSTNIQYALRLWDHLIAQDLELSLLHHKGKFAFVPTGKKPLRFKVPSELWCKTMELAICCGAVNIVP